MNRFEPKMRALHATPRGFRQGTQPIHLTEEQIQEAESWIECRLPEDYREFIKDFGDFCLHAVFPVREGYLSEASIGEFSTIGNCAGYVGRDPQWFPDDSIYIGISGNLPTHLFFKGEKKGKVYIRDYDDFCLVADSFTEFMELLEFEFENDEHEKPCVIEDAAPFWETFSTE